VDKFQFFLIALPKLRVVVVIIIHILQEMNNVSHSSTDCTVLIH